MIEPTGYTALDLIGFTDRGYFDPNATYVKNDLVHDDNESIWRVLIDDTSGVTPTEGLNYTIFIRNPQDAAKQMIAPVETSPTANAHAVGTQIIYHDVLYDVTTAIAAGGALVVYPTSGYNIKPAPLVTSQIQALTNETNDIVNVLGAKNLLPNNAISQVINGVTFTVNTDGTISASGTANGGDATLVINQTAYYPKGDYKLSGCPTGGSTATYELRVSRGFFEQADDVGNGANLSLGINALNAIYCYIKIANGTAAPSDPFKPMIRPASIEDDTYVPYAMTNRELTRDVATLNDVTVTNVTSSFTGITSGTINMIKCGKVRQLQFDNVAFANEATFPTLDTADRPKAVAFGSLTVTNDNTSGRIWLRINGTFGTGNVLGKTVMGSITWIAS